MSPSLLVRKGVSQARNPLQAAQELYAEQADNNALLGAESIQCFDALQLDAYIKG